MASDETFCFKLRLRYSQIISHVFHLTHNNARLRVALVAGLRVQAQQRPEGGQLRADAQISGGGGRRGAEERPAISGGPRLFLAGHNSRLCGVIFCCHLFYLQHVLFACDNATHTHTHTWKKTERGQIINIRVLYTMETFEEGR